MTPFDIEEHRRQLLIAGAIDLLDDELRELFHEPFGQRPDALGAAIDGREVVNGHRQAASQITPVCLPAITQSHQAAETR